jgi:hypothetical protein
MFLSEIKCGGEKRIKKKARTDIAISDEEANGHSIPEQVCTVVLLLFSHLYLYICVFAFVFPHLTF